MELLATQAVNAAAEEHGTQLAKKDEASAHALLRVQAKLASVT